MDSEIENLLKNVVKKTDATVLSFLGLGDMLLCSPIAVLVSYLYENVYFPTLEYHKESVDSFFVNHKNIHTFIVTNVTHPFHEGNLRGDVHSCWSKNVVDKTISFAENFYKN